MFFHVHTYTYIFEHIEYFMEEHRTTFRHELLKKIPYKALSIFHCDKSVRICKKVPPGFFPNILIYGLFT